MLLDRKGMGIGGLRDRKAVRRQAIFIRMSGRSPLVPPKPPPPSPFMHLLLRHLLVSQKKTKQFRKRDTTAKH